MCSTGSALTAKSKLIEQVDDFGVDLSSMRPANSSGVCGTVTQIRMAADRYRSAKEDRSDDFYELGSVAKTTLLKDGTLTTRVSLGRTMILLAHPGDEIACAGLLQHCCEPVVVFATDGTTDAESSCTTTQRHRTVRYLRRQEASTALVVAGIRRIEFLSGCDDKVQNLRLYRAVPHLFEAWCRSIARYRPETILVPAYEGGHPDHDVCSFLGALIRKQLNLPVWEMPLYHKSEGGELVYQRFPRMNGTEVIYPLGEWELSIRAVMMACYPSHRDCAAFKTDDAECYRPQPEYDYSRPPRNGTVNYGNWRHPVSPSELCRHLARFARRVSVPLAVLGVPRAARLDIR